MTQSRNFMFDENDAIAEMCRCLAEAQRTGNYDIVALQVERDPYFSPEIYPELFPRTKQYLIQYYPEALPFTQKTIREKLDYSFFGYYRLDMSQVDFANQQDLCKICDAFRRWFRMVLIADCRDAYRKQKRRRTISGDLPLYKDGNTGETILDRQSYPNLDGLDALLEQEDLDYRGKLRRYVETDPDNHLRCCTTKASRAQNWHCQQVIIRRFINHPAATLKEIGQDFKLTPQQVFTLLKKACCLAHLAKTIANFWD